MTILHSWIVQTAAYDYARSHKLLNYTHAARAAKTSGTQASQNVPSMRLVHKSKRLQMSDYTANLL